MICFRSENSAKKALETLLKEHGGGPKLLRQAKLETVARHACILRAYYKKRSRKLAPLRSYRSAYALYLNVCDHSKFCITTFNSSRRNVLLGM